MAQKMDFVNLSVNKNGEATIKIKKIELIETLKRLGYYALNYQETVQLIKIDNGRIELVTAKDIQDKFLENYILKCEPIEKPYDNGDKLYTLKPIQVKEKFYNSLNTYFSKDMLNRLYLPEPPKLAEDTQEKKYLYFRNCIVEISADEVKALEWKSLKGLHIYKNQILDRDYKETLEKGNFARFIENICRTDDKPDKTAHNGKSIDFDRKISICTIIGYLMHHYFNRSLKAIVLTDSKIGEDGEANGRTGKSLIGKALGRILNASINNSIYCEIDGKAFDPGDKNKFEKANIDTKLVHINDLKRHFDIDNLYTNVTEGFTVKKMYLAPFEIRAKMLLSTNKTLKVQGDSDLDRFFQFELSDYYSAKFKVDGEFKEWFFTDWDAAEWSRFDNFMIWCAQLYLKNGLYEAKPINLHLRMLNDHTSPDFVVWFADYLAAQLIDNAAKIDKKIAFNAFIDEYEDHKNGKFKLTQRRFTGWVRTYLKNINDGLPFSETREGGHDYFLIG